jgi:hypothetical protein
MDWSSVALAFGALLAQFLALWGLHSKQLEKQQVEQRSSLSSLQSDLLARLADLKRDLMDELRELRRDVSGTKEAQARLDGKVNGLDRRVGAIEQRKSDS